MISISHHELPQDRTDDNRITNHFYTSATLSLKLYGNLLAWF